VTYLDLINEFLDAVKIDRIKIDDEVHIEDQNGFNVELVQFYIGAYDSYIEVATNKED
jgi:hypothetical protein